VAAMIVGVVEAIVGFKTKTSWRRIQGLALITIAIFTAAGVTDQNASIVRPVLLILGAMVIIVIIVLQMYYWRLFQKMCGDSSPDRKEEPQDQLERSSTSTKSTQLHPIN